MNPSRPTARSIAAKRGSAATFRSIAPRTMYLDARKAAVAPSEAPANTSAVPSARPKMAPPARVSSEPGMKATVATV